MVNCMPISRLCPTPRKLYSKVSHMQIEWKDIDFGPINLYNVIPAYKLKG